MNLNLFKEDIINIEFTGEHRAKLSDELKCRQISANLNTKVTEICTSFN